MVVVTSTFPARPDDGTPSFVLDLAEGLSRQFDVTVVAPRMRSGSASWQGIRVIRFPYFFRRYESLAEGAIMPNLRESPLLWLQVPTFMISMTVALALVILRSKSSVIHAHWIIPAGLSARLVSLLLRRPYLLTVHGADAYTLNGRLIRALKSWVLSGASLVMPVSADIRSRLASMTAIHDEKLSEPIPMGTTSQPVPANQQRSGKTFLFVGRVADKKGLPVAIQALSMVDDAHLRVIGDGPGLLEAQRLAGRLELEERVQFLGRRGRTDVLREMSSAFGLLMPSLVSSDGDSEGTPVVLAESLATGTPIIASSVPGIAENIVDGVNGLLALPGEPQSLAECMRSALTDPAMFRKMGETARQMFDGSPLDMRVTIDRYVEAIEAISPERASR